MDEYALREMIGDIRHEPLSRRQFMQTMIDLGLTGPLAAQLLTAPGIARAQPRHSDFTPTRRGGGGPVRLLYSAAPTLPNPHLAVAPKDFEASEIFYEPLADIDADGSIVPVLASEVPSGDNGALAQDGTWVIWRLKPDVPWHDGHPFTADDVIFTWEYAADPATAATTAGSYRNIERIERLSDHAVKLVFKGPTPFWADAFCSNAGMILPRPFFDALELKGGGDAVTAARAVLQTGQYDYAWGLSMEDDVLRRLEEGGRGRVVIGRTPNSEHIQLNETDPWREVDGERSSIKTVHPFLTDPAVRSALAHLIDRGAVQSQIWGRQAETTANFLNGPASFVSPHTHWEFTVDQANRLLDDAGWQRGQDGVRRKDGQRLNLLFQTITQPARQKIQALVKQACARTGIAIELKSVVASVFSGSDPGNPDSESHFYVDLQQSPRILRHPDPQAFMRQFCSWEVAQKANQWTGANVTRWRNEEYDGLWRAPEHEMDRIKRAAMFIPMNDLVIQNVVVIPIVTRAGTFAISNTLRGFDFSPYSGPLWRLAYWHRDA